MKFVWVAVLQALAFAAAMAEVILPSFGLLAALCLGLGIASWYLILTRLPHGAALGFALLDIITLPIGLKWAFAYLGRSPLSHGAHLQGSGLEKLDDELHKYIGAVAIVDAPLRPVGRIRIGEEVFEAHSGGDWAGRGASVKVVSVSGGRLHVEKIQA